jgi:hypothetical protein
MYTYSISLPDLIALAAANTAMHPTYTYGENVAIRDHVFAMAQFEVASWTPWEVFLYVLQYVRMADGMRGEMGVGDDGGYDGDGDEEDFEEEVVQEKVAPEEECCGFLHCHDFCRFYPD